MLIIKKKDTLSPSLYLYKYNDRVRRLRSSSKSELVVVGDRQLLRVRLRYVVLHEMNLKYVA